MESLSGRPLTERLLRPLLDPGEVELKQLFLPGAMKQFREMQFEYRILVWGLLLVHDYNLAKAVVEPYCVSEGEIKLVVGHRKSVANNEHLPATCHRPVRLPQGVRMPLFQRRVRVLHESRRKEHEFAEFLAPLTLDRVPSTFSVQLADLIAVDDTYRASFVQAGFEVYGTVW